MWGGNGSRFSKICLNMFYTWKKDPALNMSWFWSYCLAEQISVLTYCWEWWAACLENRMHGWKGSAFPKQIPSLELTWNVWREVRGSVEALASYRGTQIELWDDVTDAQPQYQCSLSHHPRTSVWSDEWQGCWKQKWINLTWSWAPDGGGDWAAAVVEEEQSLKLSAEPEHTVA